MARPRSKTPSSLHRSSRPTNPGPEQYPEAEIGILDKEPGPSKSRSKTPSRRHQRRPSRPIEAEPEAEAEPAAADADAAADTDGQEVEQQIGNLLGLADATIPTAEDAPTPNEWAKFFAKAVCSIRSFHLLVQPLVLSLPRCPSPLLPFCFLFPPQPLILIATTTVYIHLSI